VRPRATARRKRQSQIVGSSGASSKLQPRNVREDSRLTRIGRLDEARGVNRDRVASKLEAATSVGATATILAGDDAATLEQLHDLTDGGPDFVFEAIGRPETIDLAVAALPVGGAAVLVGMTPFGVRASFEVYPFVDGSRRILGSNYGFADPGIDFPRYAQLHLEGRLPFDRLVDRRIGLDDVEDAFDEMRQARYTRQVVVFDA